MNITFGLPSEDEPLAYPVLAVGNFDGVHLGHQAILSQVVKRAREVRGTALALTFDPHPLKVLAPDRPLYLLTSLKQKSRIMEALGLDRLLCLPFTVEFSEQKPAEFIENILYRRIKTREVYVGRNFAFGRGREGTSEDMKRIGQSLGMKVSVIEPVLVGETVVSSSTVRKFLLDGKVSAAAALLGRPYELEGPVITGDRRGRLLGYPTANLRTPQELVPKPGVYAVEVLQGDGPEGQPQAAVGYIGNRPTFGDGEAGIEVHLFEPAGDLYRAQLRVAFLEQIRNEMTFSGSDELVRQIEKDIEKAHKIHEKIAGSRRSGSQPPG